MCGIGGFLTAHRLDCISSALDETRIRLRHRGPDGEGQWLSADETAGLCHTRLAIVDLPLAGAQPMFSADRRSVLSFNGEIYNRRQHRRELARACWSFRTHSDSEVLLTAWRNKHPRLCLRLGSPGTDATCRCDRT
jgi:asparagine synthase (glutamine-hydrolysing)